MHYLCRGQVWRSGILAPGPDASTLQLLALLREIREKQARARSMWSGRASLDLLELRDVCKVIGVSLIDFVRTFDTAVDALEGAERKGGGSRGWSGIKG